MRDRQDLDGQRYFGDKDQKQDKPIILGILYLADFVNYLTSPINFLIRGEANINNTPEAIEMYAIVS